MYIKLEKALTEKTNLKDIKGHTEKTYYLIICTYYSRTKTLNFNNIINLRFNQPQS